jgi:hypothetical protein
MEVGDKRSKWWRPAFAFSIGATHWLPLRTTGHWRNTPLAVLKLNTQARSRDAHRGRAWLVEFAEQSLGQRRRNRALRGRTLVDNPTAWDISWISSINGITLIAGNWKAQIVICYRSIDSVSGVTRETAKRLAKYLGVDETHAIHLALRELAAKFRPQYERDDHHVSAAQMRQLKKRVPHGTKRSVRSTLVEMESLPK